MAHDTSTILRVLSEDGETVTDWAADYGEPGYHVREGGCVVLGDYWCHRRDCNYPERYDNGQKKVHGLDWHYPRIFAKLEEEGCELEWSDEWVIPTDTQLAYRTQGDSYSWEPTAVWNEDQGDFMVPTDGLDVWLEWATNRADRCLMSHTFTDAELAAEGWEERECDYESGWYGHEDKPDEILTAIQAREDVDVLFKLSGNEQFRTTFCVYVRAREEVEED